MAATDRPAAAHVKCRAACSVTDRESRWVTALTGTWRARSCWALTPASCSPVEGPCSGGHLDIPAEPPESSFEVCWPVGHLHEPVGRAVLSVLTDQPARPWPGCSRRAAAWHRAIFVPAEEVRTKPGSVQFLVCLRGGLFVVGGSVRPGRDGCALDGYDKPWGDRHGIVGLRYRGTSREADWPGAAAGCRS
jgi:hypothetical protein